MTLTATPFALQGGSHGAQLFREAISSLIAPAAGIVTAGDLAVSQTAAPSMAVQVAAGRVWTAGSSLPTVNPGGGPFPPQGLYYAENDAPVSLPVAAANATAPRVDTVVCQIQDAAYAGTINSAQLAVLTGTPTPGVTVPPATSAAALADGGAPVPVSSIVLGYVLVPAAAVSIVAADVANVASVMPAATVQLAAPAHAASHAKGAPDPVTLASIATTGSDVPQWMADALCPWRINLNPLTGNGSVSTGTWSTVQNSNQIGGGLLENTSGNLNDSYSWYLTFAKGIWQLAMFTAKPVIPGGNPPIATGGIATIALDGQTVFNVDQYTPAAATAYNQYFAGQFAVPATGVHRLQFTITGKNPSSYGYGLLLSRVSLQRVS